MKIAILNSGEHEQVLFDIVKNLKCIATKEELLKNGFTNYNKPIIYYCKSLNKKHDITFSIEVSANNLEIKEILILDENFMQPYFVNKEYNEKIKAIIDDLIDKKLFEKG